MADVFHQGRRNRMKRNIPCLPNTPQNDQDTEFLIDLTFHPACLRSDPQYAKSSESETTKNRPCIVEDITVQQRCTQILFTSESIDPFLRIDRSSPQRFKRRLITLLPKYHPDGHLELFNFQVKSEPRFQTSFSLLVQTHTEVSNELGEAFWIYYDTKIR